MADDDGDWRETELYHQMFFVTTFLLAREADLPRSISSCRSEVWNEFRGCLLKTKVPADISRAQERDLLARAMREAVRAVLARWKLTRLGPEFRETFNSGFSAWRTHNADEQYAALRGR